MRIPCPFCGMLALAATEEYTAKGITVSGVTVYKCVCGHSWLPRREEQRIDIEVWKARALAAEDELAKIHAVRDLDGIPERLRGSPVGHHHTSGGCLVCMAANLIELQQAELAKVREEHKNLCMWVRRLLASKYAQHEPDIRKGAFDYLGRIGALGDALRAAKGDG